MKFFIPAILDLPIKTKFLILTLVLMFLDYRSYGFYVFYLPFIYLLIHNGFKLVDRFFFCLLLFGCSYASLYYLNMGAFSIGAEIVPIVNIPILYLIGKYIAKYNSRESLVIILFFFALALAFISVISIFKDISLNGFYVTGIGGRNIPLIGIKSGIEMSATGISSRMMILTFFISFIFIPYETRKKVWIICISSTAFLCIVRIQSRTAIIGSLFVLFIISILTWNSRNIKQKIVFITCLIILFMGFTYVISNYSDQLAVLERFQDDDMATGNGRSVLLYNVASNMSRFPLGGMNKYIPFAHNLWFDCFRVGGFIPFILLWCITFIFLFKLYKFFVTNKDEKLLCYTIGLVSLAIFFVFMSEPVLEGIPMVFQFFSMFSGIVFYLSKRQRLIMIK